MIGRPIKMRGSDAAVEYLDNERRSRLAAMRSRDDDAFRLIVAFRVPDGMGHRLPPSLRASK